MLFCGNAGEAKQLSNSVKPENRNGWTENKYEMDNGKSAASQKYVNSFLGTLGRHLKFCFAIQVIRTNI